MKHSWSAGDIVFRPGEEPDTGRLDEEFEFCGGGLFREVWLISEKSVVKVARGNPYSNLEEARVWEALKDTSIGPKLAKVRACDPDGWWLIQEYLPESCAWDNEAMEPAPLVNTEKARVLKEELEYEGPFDDLHNGNIRLTSDGRAKVTDYSGCSPAEGTSDPVIEWVKRMDGPHEENRRKARR